MESELDTIISKPISYIFKLVDKNTNSYPVYDMGEIYLLSETKIKYKPIINLSKYYVFLGLPNGGYDLVIENSNYYQNKVLKNLSLPLLQPISVNTSNIDIISLEAYIKPDDPPPPSP